MKDNHDDDFKDMGWFGSLLALGMVVILVLLAILLVFGIFFFGIAGFFSLLGVTYESVKALVYFTLLLLLIDFFIYEDELFHNVDLDFEEYVKED